MEASLGVPTATSTRAVPARLLEVNRRVVNGHLERVGGTKVSYTHLIGFAVVRALTTVPAMKSTYVAEPAPSVKVNEHVGLGLAVDLSGPTAPAHCWSPASSRPTPSTSPPSTTPTRR